MAMRSDDYDYRCGSQWHTYSSKSLIKSVKIKVSDDIHRMLLQDCHGDENEIKRYLGNIHSEMVYSTCEHAIDGPFEALWEADVKLMKLWEMRNEEADDQNEKVKSKRCDNIDNDDDDNNVMLPQVSSHDSASSSSSPLLENSDPEVGWKSLGRGGNNHSYHNAIFNQGNNNNNSIVNANIGDEATSFERRKDDRGVRGTENAEPNESIKHQNRPKLETNKEDEAGKSKYTFKKNLSFEEEGALLPRGGISHDMADEMRSKSISCLRAKQSNEELNDVIQLVVKTEMNEAISRSQHDTTPDVDLETPGVHGSYVKRKMLVLKLSSFTNVTGDNGVQNTRRMRTMSENSRIVLDKNNFVKPVGDGNLDQICCCGYEVNHNHGTKCNKILLEVEKVNFPRDINVDILRDMIEIENRYKDIRFTWHENACHINGPDRDKVKKTKMWMENRSKIETENLRLVRNIHLAMSDHESSEFALECSIVPSEGCFVMFRYFLSNISFKRLNFCHKNVNLIIYLKDKKARDKAKENFNELEKSCRVSNYKIPSDLTQTCMVQKAGSSGVFIQFIDNGEYLIVGNDNDKNKLEKNCRERGTHVKLFNETNNNKIESCSLKITLDVSSTLLKSSKCNIVIFGCNLESTLQKFGFEKFLKANKHNLKISDKFHMFHDDGKRIFFIKKPPFRKDSSYFEELKDMYKTALYNASDGVKCLVMPLAMIDKYHNEDSITALCDTIKDYVLGYRVHDKLKTINIICDNPSQLRNIQHCFMRFN